MWKVRHLDLLSISLCFAEGPVGHDIRINKMILYDDKQYPAPWTCHDMHGYVPLQLGYRHHNGTPTPAADLDKLNELKLVWFPVNDYLGRMIIPSEP